MQSCGTWINCVWVVTPLSPQACMLIKQNIWRGRKHTVYLNRRDAPLIQSAECFGRWTLGCACLLVPRSATVKIDKQPIPGFTDLIEKSWQRKDSGCWPWVLHCAARSMQANTLPAHAPTFSLMCSVLYKNTDWYHRGGIWILLKTPCIYLI